eukprot:Clim_evm90s172 gene=Clim_evmTU90s172
MSFLFKSKNKSPQDIAKTTREALAILEKKEKGSNDKAVEKANEDITKSLFAIKQILYGDGEQPNNTDMVVAQLAQEFYHGLLESLIHNLDRLDFEAKKDFAQIFSNLLRRQTGSRSPTVEKLYSKQDLLFDLLKGYENPEIALNCGLMLRECIRNESLAGVILRSEDFYNLFDYVELPTFDVASDAFATFKDLLTKHKGMVATFLEENYDRFFEKLTHLLASENYVTRRQSLKLLGELLLDRQNFNIMTKYISNPDNLKLMMNLLRDKSRNIQFEAFHVFKVFVANPNKPKPIMDILLKNRTKLIEFLSKFHEDRSEDEQFNDEKQYLIKQIKALEAPES